MAGGVGLPAMSEGFEGQSLIDGSDTNATCAMASPGTAMQGVAHAGCGAFFCGAGDPLSSHPAIAEAIGDACALASQIGPSRTSNIIASTARPAMRKTLARGRHRDFTFATGSFSDPKSTAQCAVDNAGAAIIQIAIATIIRFSVSEMKPSGTLLSPPTQAHFSSRLSI